MMKIAFKKPEKKEENEQAYREGFYKIFGAYPEEIWSSKPTNNS